MPSSEPDVTVVVCAHHEGTLAHYTLRSLRRSVTYAIRQGLAVQVLCVLDRPDAPTRSFMTAELGPEGSFTGLCSCSLIEADFGDPGLSRNAGVAASRARYVAMLDADNLPSENWLVESLRALAAHGAPGIAHPEQLVLFGERHELLPQWASDDPRLRVENFYDCNYWDTACVAGREVFEAVPYTRTRGGTGFGYEDWHWNTQTLDAGIGHVIAKRTALFYRVKFVDSVNTSNFHSSALIPPTPLLTDPRRIPDAAQQEAPREIARERKRTSVQERVVRAWQASAPPDVVVAERESSGSRRFAELLNPGGVVPEHYRLLYADARDLNDRQVRAHYRKVGRPAGRRGRLTTSELADLRPDVFQVAHYRVLHADIAGFSDAEAVRHFLQHGRAEGRRTHLTPPELEALERLDVRDYRLANRDLSEASDAELVVHALRHGRLEGRPLELTTPVRDALATLDGGEWLHAEWSAAHHIEPRIPMPTKSVLQTYRVIGPPSDGSLTPASAVWWRVVGEMGPRCPRALFFAPWMKLGGAEAPIAPYAAVIAHLRPDLDVVVVTTDEVSTLPERLPEGVRVLELPRIEGFLELTHDQRRDLVARMVVQYGPELVHVFNSAAAFDAVEAYPDALAHSSRIFLSTYEVKEGPEGELHCYLAKRAPAFLDRVRAVIVNSNAFVEVMYDRFRHPREKFVVHHQVVDPPPRPPRPARDASRPLRIIWVARFDDPERIRVFADVVELCVSAQLQVEWHAYGNSPVVEDGGNADALARLARRGVTLRVEPSDRDPIDTDAYDAIVLLPSEAEGLHPALLEAIAGRLPVVAPMVGDVGDLLDHTTAFSVSTPEAVADYVQAFTAISEDSAEVQERVEAAFRLLDREFSWSAFRRRVEDTGDYVWAADGPAGHGRERPKTAS